MRFEIDGVMWTPQEVESLEEVGVCDLCGSETAWMGRNVRCEECGEGVYQKLQEAATEKGGE